MYDYERERGETQEHLSHEVHVTRHHKKDEDYARSQVVQLAVSCLSSKLVLLFMLYTCNFRSQFCVVESILFT